MNLILMFLATITSSVFMNLTHPMSFIILILIQSTTMCVLIFYSLYSGWFSIMLFLVFTGGLMVLFIYIASLASNEKFELDPKLFVWPLIMSFTLFTFFNFYSSQLNLYTESMNFKHLISQIYSTNMVTPIIMAMLFLLLTLLITVNIIKLYEAPIRSLIK